MAWPLTNCWPAAYIWMTTYCAFGDAAVPGNTSTTFIRWNVANAGADAAISPAAHAVAMSLRSMFHAPGLKVGRCDSAASAAAPYARTFPGVPVRAGNTLVPVHTRVVRRGSIG